MKEVKFQFCSSGKKGHSDVTGWGKSLYKGPEARMNLSVEEFLDSMVGAYMAQRQWAEKKPRATQDFVDLLEISALES